MKLTHDKIIEIARNRAKFNPGGILLTAIYKFNPDGLRARVILDGGNFYDHKYNWVISTASGWGYDVISDALAKAIREITGITEKDIDWGDERHIWAERLKSHGWKMYFYDKENIVLIPENN